MKNGFLIIGGIGAFLYYKVHTIIKAIEASSIRVKGGKLVKLASSQQSYINIQLQISNPTNTTYSIGSFKGSLTYQGNVIATVNYTGNAVIKPGVTIVNFPATLNNITTVNTVVNIISNLLNGNFNQSVTLTGVLTKYGYRHPVNETFTLNSLL